MKIRGWSFLVLILIVTGCTWGFDEADVYKADRQPAPPRGTIVLRDHADGEVITIDTVTQFRYEVQNYDPIALGEIDVALGSKYFYEGGPIGDFTIGKDLLVKGTYELKIVYTARSNSGSLASHYGLEIRQLTKSWILVIDTKE